MTGSKFDTSSAGLNRSHYLLIAAAGICYLLDGITHSIMGPLAPAIAAEFGLRKAELGSIFSANLVGQIIGLTLVPLLQARVSHRWIIVCCTAAFGVLEVATGLATTAEHLIQLRFLTGIGLGGAIPSALALVAGNVPPSKRGTAVMILFFGYGGGQVLSGVLASVFPGEHWRSALYWCGTVSVVYALIASRVLRFASSVSSASTPRRRETGLATIFSRPLMSGTLAIWLVITSAFSINFCLTSWLPTLLTGIGYSPGTAAFAVSSFALGGVIATVVVGPLIDRFGSYKTVLTLFALAATFLLIDAALIFNASATLFLVVTAIAGFFVLGGLGGINVVLVDLYPDAARAIGAGWAKSVSRLGAVIPPILVGFALDHGMTQRSIVGLIALLALTATLGMVLLARQYGPWRNAAHDQVARPV
jgi:AAHS family 4-hydroxybenzoate transporter-like MFS transporter